jgi:hypothetical protein
MATRPTYNILGSSRSIRTTPHLLAFAAYHRPRCIVSSELWLCMQKYWMPRIPLYLTWYSLRSLLGINLGWNRLKRILGSCLEPGKGALRILYLENACLCLVISKSVLSLTLRHGGRSILITLFSRPWDFVFPVSVLSDNHVLFQPSDPTCWGAGREGDRG